MGARIHPTAVVDPSAELADGVSVGAHAVVGAEVILGEDTEIRAGAQVLGPAVLGRENRVFGMACVGFEPQDLKFEGEVTRLEIGDRNTVREFASLHRGTGLGGGITKVGNDNLFMAYSHVAHDCIVGDRTVFSNAGTLAGHVEVHDDAVMGAFSAVHQFCRVGCHAYIGGYSVITNDALPYVKTVGLKPACVGVNRVGLQRKGFDEEALRRLEAAYRVLVRSKLNTTDALVRLRADEPIDPLVQRIIDFVSASQRGVITRLPRAGWARG